MKFSGLRLDVADGLAHIVFAEPTRGNPIDGALSASLCECAVRISEDHEVRCVLISAEGEVFSYGGDISAFIADLEGAASNIKRWTALFHSAVSRFQRMDAPLVAAVQGPCAGGMCGFIAGCDVVVAAEDARFVAGYAGIGFSCDAGASIMLPRRMGLARARRFLLLNQTLTASEALAAGLVDEVVATSEMRTRAQEVACQLSRGPTRAFAEIRRLMLSAESQPLETQLELEAQALARVVGSQDAQTGLLAFAQKRKLEFMGR